MFRWYVSFYVFRTLRFSFRTFRFVSVARFVLWIIKDNAELGFDYVFVNGHESSVTVSVEIYDRDGTLLSRSQPISVPLVRNKVTIVRGKFLTVKAEGGVSIDADFDGEYNYEYR